MSRARRPTVLAALALALTGAAAQGAQAAPIDDFAEAGTLHFSTRPSLSTQGFTATGEPAAGCATIGRTGWWRMTGTGQRFTVTTAGSNFNTVLEAYETAGAPGATNRRACNDDAAAGTQTSTISFDTTRGSSYLVRAGGLNSTYGVLVLSAEAPRPANDDRANALPVAANTARSVDSTGASTEPGETRACATDDYDATVWFRFSSPGIGDARFAASANFPTAPNPGDTVMTVFRASDGAVLGCNDDAGAGAGGSAVALRLAAGDYLVQVGGHAFGLGKAGEGLVNLQVDYAEDLDLDDDGSPRPGDCRDDDPAIHPGVPDILDDAIDQDCVGGPAVNLDRDADGYQRPTDCDDADRTVNPGAADTPGDGRDEDCSGADAPFPVLQSGITGFFAVYPAWTKVTDILVRRAPAGAKVTVSCKGRGCPLKRRSIAVERARDRVPLLKLVGGAKLRTGARLRVKVTKPLTIGLVTTWKIRASKPPLRTDRCVRPGERRLRRCP